MNFMKLLMLLVFFTLFLSLHTYANGVQRVTILADDSYPPYSFVENGELKGIYVDIIATAATLLASKYDVKIVSIPWKRGLLEIQEGREFAILPPYKHLVKRPYIWPYSLPIMTENVMAYCHKDISLSNYLNQSAVNTYPPLNIGINAGYLILNNELQQAEKNRNIIIRENKSTLANIMKLYSRRVDCYLNDKLSTEWEIARISEKRIIQLNEVKATLMVMTKTAHIGYTNNKDHPFLFKDDFIKRMDEAISQVIASGKYQEVIASYK